MSRLTRACGVGGALLIAALSVSGAMASSHREAPLISMDPEADSTDLYAFVDPVDSRYVDLVANYIPMEDPAGGPNFWLLDPTVKYVIHVDNNGDGSPDVSFEFRFKTIETGPNSFLYNNNQVTSVTDPNLLVRQTYSLTRVTGNHSTVLGSNIPTAPANIGPRSTPDYPTTADGAIRSVSGGIKAFAGQRDDPFFVDLGSIFDLGGLRPFNAAHLIPGTAASGIDDLAGMNVQSIAVQVPITSLTGDHARHAASDVKGVIGVWTAAYRQSTTVRSTTARSTAAARGGRFRASATRSSTR